MTATAQKLTGFEFFRKALNGAQKVVAPMVDQSELAWRMLSRKYGAELCYTPMFNARVFVESESYRNEMFTTCPEDRPLIVQFCANDPDNLLNAAKFVEDKCDAVDLNLGCPQHIARRGHYGSFLMEEWDLIAKMVNNLHVNLKVPVTCKIRIFPSLEKTIQYAQMLEKAGCQLLTVHGRLREQKGHKTGLADWKVISAVKKAVKIPVYANGNILYPWDVKACMDETGVDGVMTAEGNLYNPAILAGLTPPVYQMAREYMELVKIYPTTPAYVRAHLFKLFHCSLSLHTNMRDKLAACHTNEQYADFVDEFSKQLEQEAALLTPEQTPAPPQYPHWICQPHFRVIVGEPLSAEAIAAGWSEKKIAHDLVGSTSGAGGEASKEEQDVYRSSDEKSTAYILNTTVDVQSTANSPDTNQNFVNPPTSTLNSTNTVKSKRPLEEDTNAAETSSTAPAPSSPIAHVAKKARRGRQNLTTCPICHKNPRSDSCTHLVCKTCCIQRCIVEVKDCARHRYFFCSNQGKANKKDKANGAEMETVKDINNNNDNTENDNEIEKEQDEGGKEVTNQSTTTPVESEQLVQSMQL